MEELVESILDYIRADYTDYAIMINGEWGSGKTYFWNNKIRKKIDSISTDSLNGALTALKEFKNATNSYQIITRKVTEQEAQDVLKRRI